MALGGLAMPYAAKRPCTWPGCAALVQDGSRCDQHRRLQDRQRGTARQRGYTSKWEKAREAFLREHPLCAECERQHRVKAATVVDHIVPHCGDQVLFWNRGNWQSMCKPCHDRKTATQDSAFARPRGRSEP